MTVIAWDGRFVAADSMGVAGSTRSLAKREKLRWRHGILYGFAGSIPLFEPMIEWHFRGAKPGDIPKGSRDDDNSALFVFNSKGAGWLYKTEMSYPEQLSPPDAWGAAADHVIGGLDAGLSAPEAIESALKREIWIGGPVQVVDLNVNAEAAADQCEHSWVDASDPDIRCGKCGYSKPRVTA